MRTELGTKALSDTSTAPTSTTSHQFRAPSATSVKRRSIAVRRGETAS